MFGRFFAFEMGCPEEDATPGTNLIAYLNEDGSISQIPDQMQDMPDQAPELGPDGMPMIYECRGLGCKKCKRKKAQIITLTGNPNIPLPVMNMPMGPGGPGMIMMGRPRFF